jgi:hypothetical protein
MGKNPEPTIEKLATREMSEADYFARKCGLTQDEAQRMIDEAASRSPSKPAVGRAKERQSTNGSVLCG